MTSHLCQCEYRTSIPPSNDPQASEVVSSALATTENGRCEILSRRPWRDGRKRRQNGGNTMDSFSTLSNPCMSVLSSVLLMLVVGSLSCQCEGFVPGSSGYAPSTRRDTTTSPLRPLGAVSTLSSIRSSHRSRLVQPHSTPRHRRRTSIPLMYSPNKDNNDNEYNDDNNNSRAKRRQRRRKHIEKTRMNTITYARNKGVTDDAIIVQRLFASSSTNPPLVELDLLGQGAVSSNNNRGTVTCLFLSPPSECDSIHHHQPAAKAQPSSPLEASAIPIPLLPTPSSISRSPTSILKLTSFAYRSTPISKSLCLTLNPLLINRDGGLYDNIPWDTWTIDPDGRNRDVAGNPVEAKYHLGKRDVYDRFMGKDWYGRSLSVGNVVARVGYMLSGDGGDGGDGRGEEEGDLEVGGGEGDETMMGPTFDEAAAVILARRVLELELKEAGMAVAEAEEQLAIIRNDADFSFDAGTAAGGGEETEEEMIDRQLRQQEAIDHATQAVIDAKSFQLQLLEALDSSSMTEDDDGDEKGGEKEEQSANSPKGFLGTVTSAILNQQQNNPPPYRGAIGYPPIIDTYQEVYTKSTLPYSSPYELMKEIINEQLHAEVIGCVIENTSLFPGAVVPGGAVVLRRKGSGRKQTVTIDGERVETAVDDDGFDYGNEGVGARKVFVVECDCDEAIGMAMACGLGVGVESDIWERARTVVRVRGGDDSVNSAHVMDVLPRLENMDKSIVIETQGDGVASTSTPIQIPRTDSSRQFDRLGELSSEGNVESATFDTDNPVQSLSTYDELSDTDKAQILLSLQSFQGELPRPRVLRQDAEKKKRASRKKKNNTTSFSPLDRLLIPFIDESVRGQLLIREAERRGDSELASSLRDGRSRRQIAKELADLATNAGNQREAKKWEDKADFYASLRADVTQDEGSYSSYLDKDDWYEQTRLNLSKKLDKKKFGTLLDGIE